MKEDKYCPCCGRKLSLFYLKPNCPACGADILRYNAEERLKQDAVQAEKEVEALWGFFRKADKARLIEKYCKKKGKPLPWEERDPEIRPEPQADNPDTDKTE